MTAIPEKVALCGIKHCGKTTLGKLLAEFRHVPFFDSDREIENAFSRETGKDFSCRDIFREAGEEAFRKREAQTLRQLAAGPGPAVVALGGGAAANPFLEPEFWRRFGVVVQLKIADRIAFRRMLSEGLPPFLAETADPFAAFLKLNRERETFFSRAANLTWDILQEQPPETEARLLAIAIEEFEKNER